MPKSLSGRPIQMGWNGKRLTFYFGPLSSESRVQVRRHLKALRSSRLSGDPLPPAAAEWLGGLPDKKRRQLECCGLVGPSERRERMTYDAFVRAFIEGRRDVKESTVRNYWQTHKLSEKYFGDKLLDEITPGDAEGFRVWMKSKPQEYSEGNTRRRCGMCRQFFAWARKCRLITENPFDGVKCSNFADGSRRVMVSQADSLAVLGACADAQWRLIFALCRYGGLRCPSEVLGLRWGDVDWANNRFTVHAVKTEHHEGGGVRVVPIFGELMPYLREAFDLAEEGSVFVITRYRESENLRTELKRIVHRAGLTPWPKLFQNLRATRATELRERFPSHVVNKWLGHTEGVAEKHYLQVTDEHWRRAAESAAESAAVALRKALQQERVLVGTDRPLDSNSAENAGIPGDSADGCRSVPIGADMAENGEYARQDSNL